MFSWFADYVTYGLFRLTPGNHLADSLNFFLYDVPKIYFLLAVIVFFVALIRTYLPPGRSRSCKHCSARGWLWERRSLS